MVFLKNYLWTVPFLSFLLGYQCINLVYGVNEIKTPCLVGTTVEESFTILSNNNLNPRLLAHKQEPDIPHGTILSQTPTPGTKIKANQSVFLVVSQQPPKKVAPNLLQKKTPKNSTQLKKDGIRHYCYQLESSQPKNFCIAQHPQPGEPLPDKTLISYVSTNENTPVLVPDFKNKHIKEIKEFLAHYPVKLTINHAHGYDHPHCNCLVTDQRPLAGSITTLDYTKPLLLQLQV